MAFGALSAVLPEATSFGPARQGLKDCNGVLQQDFDHRQGGVEVGISTGKDGLRFLAFLVGGRRREGSFVHLAEHGENHREPKEDKTEATD